MTQPTFKPEEYIRRPLVVLAQELSETNIYDVAAWCGGEVRSTEVGKDGKPGPLQQYIKVPVRRPLNEKQTRAYIGDWVLQAGSGFKVYTAKAFTSSFQKRVKDMLDTVERMIQREDREEAEEKDQHDSTTPDSLPVGGTNTSFVSP